MNKTALHWLGRSLAVAAAALSVGCANDAPLSPARRPALDRAADLPAGCEKLQAPAGSTLAFHAYASGAQIYRWDGGSWVFVAPAATLFADEGGSGTVGTHYAGPTWESNSGSTVVGAVANRCTPDANAIPWLSLDAVPGDGPGIFHETKFIQRLNTVGGKAPTTPGSVPGEVKEVPYTAEYFFYQVP
ncbi:MAG TPA: DUF3455 domain-containing protein [Gemmatimonadaceae bacterium]|nr:DUF3455 domain-containing protein [Gemmatimonadaceae bacterium]